VGDPGAVIYPDRDSGTTERADPAGLVFEIARTRASF
jgi:hypothetical protein